MSRQYILKMYGADDECRTENVCFYFRLVKDVYVPYVYFEGKFISSYDEIGEINRIEFWDSSKLLHQGLVDSIEITRSSGRRTISVKSKGFTSLLCQNQPEPGMMTDATVDKLLALYPEIPYITSDDSGSVNYIFIKDGSTVWDSICNLAFRQNRIYPYIMGTNTVKITPRKYGNSNILPENYFISSGIRHDFTKLISHIHMQDVDGNYNIYNKDNSAAVSRNIVRHKQIPLDRQFLYDPDSAPDYKLDFSMRGMIYNYMRFRGMYELELFDRVRSGEHIVNTIHRIDVIFDGSIAVTEAGA